MKRGHAEARRLIPTLGACEDCGGTATDRHHKDGNATNNVRENIATLCRRCHMRADGRLDGMGLLPRYTVEPRPCAVCGVTRRHYAHSLCRHCYGHRMRGTVCRCIALGRVGKRKFRAASHTERTR